MSGTDEQMIPVEQVTTAHRLVLPGSRTVEVERVDTHPDPRDPDGIVYVVRWCSAARHGRGHRLAGEPVDLGSLKAQHAGDLVKVTDA